MYDSGTLAPVSKSDTKDSALPSMPPKKENPSLASPLPILEKAKEFSTEQKPVVSYFEKWCQRTPWHGVQDFHIASDYFWKITWFLLIVAASFFAMNQSASMIMDFASSDQWVSSVTYEVPKGRMDWPNMLVCGSNWFVEMSMVEEWQKCKKDKTNTDVWVRNGA